MQPNFLNLRFRLQQAREAARLDQMRGMLLQLDSSFAAVERVLDDMEAVHKAAPAQQKGSKHGHD